jgi:hypothetical protein
MYALAHRFCRHAADCRSFRVWQSFDSDEQQRLAIRERQ